MHSTKHPHSIILEGIIKNSITSSVCQSWNYFFFYIWIYMWRFKSYIAGYTLEKNIIIFPPSALATVHKMIEWTLVLILPWSYKSNTTTKCRPFNDCWLLRGPVNVTFRRYVNDRTIRECDINCFVFICPWHSWWADVFFLLIKGIIFMMGQLNSVGLQSQKSMYYFISLWK